MTLTDIQQVRLTTRDFYRLADVTQYGDGSAQSFLLSHQNVVSGSAYVPATGGWSATGATFNSSGAVAFSAAISANSAYRLTYQHATFSDDEISAFIVQGGGDWRGGAVEVCKALLFDGFRRARWSSPDGTSYDDTAALRTIADTYDRLVAERAQYATLEGGAVEWGMNQGNW